MTTNKQTKTNLVHSRAVKVPIRRQIIAPTSDGTVLNPTLFGREALSIRNISNVDERLQRRTHNKEAGIERRVLTNTANKFLRCFEKMVTVGVKENIGVKEQDTLVLNKLENADLRAIDN